MAKGYVIIILSILIICTGCSRTSKEIELQNKVEQLQKQVDELKKDKHEDDVSNVEETTVADERKKLEENETETKFNTNGIDTKELDLSSQSKEDIYNDAIVKFQNGQFELSQQMFVYLDDFQDSSLYRQYLNLLLRVQNINYKFYKGENLGDLIHVDGFKMNIAHNQFSLRVIKMFGDYYLTTASLNSNSEELCITGDKGQIEIIKMQFKNGVVSTFRTEVDSTYVTDDRALDNIERDQKIAELEEKSRYTGKYTKNNTKTDPIIGMTSEEVIGSTWGKPNKINKTTYAWGVTEQWCYKDNKYVYLENGSVVAIQE